VTRHFLSLFDFQEEEIANLLHRAASLKKAAKAGKFEQPLANKTLGMIFEKSSTRTRVSFEVAMVQLGGHGIYLTQQTSQLGRGESYEDTARVLSRYVQGIVMRTFEHTKLERLASASGVPVINGLSDLLHPCQLLADLLTVQENKKNLQDLKVVWLGDGNNMANSWIEAASIFKFHLTLACPKNMEPSGIILQKIKSNGSDNIELTQDPLKAVEGADVLNADTWVSMGQEAQIKKNELRAKGDAEVQKKRILEPYQLNQNLLSRAKKDAIVLHCLPAHRGEEITNEVMDGPQSRIWDQAENRLHAQKALLEKLLS